MACPALPLCPLAITEAERGIPDILKRVRAVFEKVLLWPKLIFLKLKRSTSSISSVIEMQNVYDLYVLLTSGWSEIQ